MSIAVGQKAPDFTLQDQSKKEVKLSDFAGKKKVVLVLPAGLEPDLYE
jgi:peroxiredoxin